MDRLKHKLPKHALKDGSFASILMAVKDRWEVSRAIEEFQKEFMKFCSKEKRKEFERINPEYSIAFRKTILAIYNENAAVMKLDAREHLLFSMLMIYEPLEHFQFPLNPPEITKSMEKMKNNREAIFEKIRHLGKGRTIGSNAFFQVSGFMEGVALSVRKLREQANEYIKNKENSQNTLFLSGKKYIIKDNRLDKEDNLAINALLAIESISKFVNMKIHIWAKRVQKEEKRKNLLVFKLKQG